MRCILTKNLRLNSSIIRRLRLTSSLGRAGNYFEKLPERNIYIETLHYRLQIALKNDIMVKLYSPDKMVGIQH